MAIQWEPIRLGSDRLDERFLELISGLEDTYYGFWKRGLPREWRLYNVLPTPEANKEQFDRLHAMIWHAHRIVFHNINLDLPESQRISQSEYETLRDEDGVVIFNRIDESKAFMSETERIVDSARILQAVEEKFGRKFQWQ